MKKSFLILVFCLPGIFTAAVPAQDDSSPTRPNTSVSPRGRIREDNSPARPSTIVGREDESATLTAPPRPLDQIRKETRDKIKLSDRERDVFRQTLGDRKANIVRLISAFSCSSTLVIDISDPRCLENPDLSIVSHYSFRIKQHGDGAFTDISLMEDELKAGNKWHTVGMIADLGDAADFGKFDETADAAKALWEMPEAQTLAEKNKQKEDLEKGITLGDMTIVSKIKFEANHTYLLRTTAYRLDGNYSGPVVGSFGWHNTDSLFVFKVLSTGPDRTVTVAWKKLQQRVAPILKDKEREKAK